MSMPPNKLVRKAVFPVAGLGTRFLPATKVQPKEMLPIVDKPLIQYAVEEAVCAGITEMIFVTGRGKRSIEDHFDHAYELEAELAAKGKAYLLEKLASTAPRGVHFAYVRQDRPLGLGHAVCCARILIGDEPFAVLLADDLMRGEGGAGILSQMVQLYAKTQASVIAVQEVSRKEVSSYGIVSTSLPSGLPEGCEKVEGIVEKPHPDEAPSSLAVVGRYVLGPGVFQYLEQLETGANGEFQLTDALNAFCATECMLAYRFFGKRFDCGSKLGYLEATVALGLQHPEVGARFAAYLASRKRDGALF